MIILEGPDGSGKSTLAIKLAGVLSTVVSHAGGPPTDRIDFYMRVGQQAASKGKVLDRASLISDLVYGKVLRGGAFVSEEEALILLRKFFSKWILIYCRPDDETLEEYAVGKMKEIVKGKPYKGPAHVEGVRKNILAIAKEYDELIGRIRKSTNLEVLVYVRNKSVVQRIGEGPGQNDLGISSSWSTIDEKLLL